MEYNDEDLLNLSNIVCSGEWLSILKVWRDYSENLQERMNQFVKSGDYRNADRTQAKMECVLQMANLVKIKIQELRGIKNKKGGE